MAGRIFFATDTRAFYYDTGSAWVQWRPAVSPRIALAPAAAGNFTVAHGLGAAPAAVGAVQMTSDGRIWWQTPAFDATNLYLVASDPGITGNAPCSM
jgi:hypothetical protein